MNLLFIHNTIPEYRILFMKKLNKLINTEFLIINKQLSEKIYGLESSQEMEDLDVKYLLNSCKKRQIKLKIKESDAKCVVLPPADNILQYLVGLYALFYAKKYNKKVVYWCEKWEADFSMQPLIKKIKNIIHRLIIFSLTNNSDICIASGSKSKEYLMKIGINHKKIEIAIDSSTSTSNTEIINIKLKYGIPNNAKVILYFGRIIKRKGCHILIKSFNELYKENRDIYLIICGDGEYEDYCKKMVSNMNCERIIFTGKINPNMRKLYYTQADVFVLPSISLNGTIEAWGLTVNEAMECGLPVIATTAVGAAYDLITNKNGVLIEENNVSQLKNAIVRIIDNIDNIDYKNNCVNTAKKFSVDKMARSFAEAIFNLE